MLTLAWGAGRLLGARAEQARVLRARVAAAERERTQITRELHDLVAHSVSSMVVQASAVRRLLRDDQSREREALLTVEQTGRDALAEMRRMVGVMRSADASQPSLAPQPGLRHLDSLIEQIEAEGLPVTLRVEGERPEPVADLTGLRERLALYGGTLDAEPWNGGGIVLRASLPVGAR